MAPKIQRISLGLLSSILLPTNLVLAQQQFPEPFAYPTKGQTPEQQQQTPHISFSLLTESPAAGDHHQ